MAAALVRSTDSVPSTTQKPCCTSVRWATSTARASATAPRAALRNQTERMLACRAASPAAPARPPSFPAAAGPAWLPYQLRRWAAMVSRSACPAAIMASAAAPRATTEID